MLRKFQKRWVDYVITTLLQKCHDALLHKNKHYSLRNDVIFVDIKWLFYKLGLVIDTKEIYVFISGPLLSVKHGELRADYDKMEKSWDPLTRNRQHEKLDEFVKYVYLLDISGLLHYQLWKDNTVNYEELNRLGLVGCDRLVARNYTHTEGPYKAISIGGSNYILRIITSELHIALSISSQHNSKSIVKANYSRDDKRWYNLINVTPELNAKLNNILILDNMGVL